MDGQKNGQKRRNGRKNGQTNRRNFTNFKRNLAMMVIYLPVKFEFDWSNRFKVRVWKRKCGQTDGWTDKRTKNGQTNTRNFTNFERNLAMMVIYLPVKFEFDWSNRFKVRVRKRKMWTDRRTDRQTDVGHINLISGLVTRNPPNNVNREKIHVFGVTNETGCAVLTCLCGKILLTGGALFTGGFGGGQSLGVQVRS